MLVVEKVMDSGALVKATGALSGADSRMVLGVSSQGIEEAPYGVVGALQPDGVRVGRTRQASVAIAGSVANVGRVLEYRQGPRTARESRRRSFRLRGCQEGDLVTRELGIEGYVLHT